MNNAYFKSCFTKIKYFLTNIYNYCCIKYYNILCACRIVLKGLNVV